ncbi:MFS transporter [Rhizobium sp. PAMB 3182]
MRRNIFPVFALLLGALFLFIGNGLHGLLLPVRGASEGYSTTVLGLLGTAWAGGFVTGCFVAPALVRRIGHVRAFSGCISLIAIVALLTGLVVNDVAWVGLRALTGFASAGTSMIVESWLNERATNESRGTIFSLYFVINLSGVVAGQMVVSFGDVHTPVLFMVCGILYCVAMLPTTLSNAASPQPLKNVKLDLKSLFSHSPVAFVGILLIGIANGAFGTLGAVFGARAGLPQASIGLMMSAAIFAGALLQLPAGRISDRMDRRYVLAALAGIAALAGLILVVLQPTNVVFLIVIVAIYGGTANTLYPIAVAHANDHAGPDEFVKVSGGLLLLFGIGTIIGPTVGGPVMSALGPYALFLITAIAHIATVGYAILRTRMRAAVPIADRETFTTVSNTPNALSTPQSAELDPRAGGEGRSDGLQAAE